MIHINRLKNSPDLILRDLCIHRNDALKELTLSYFSTLIDIERPESISKCEEAILDLIIDF